MVFNKYTLGMKDRNICDRYPRPKQFSKKITSTEHKCAEETQPESEAKFRALVEATGAAINLIQRHSDRWNEEKKFHYFQCLQTTVEQLSQLIDEVLMLSGAEKVQEKSNVDKAAQSEVNQSILAAQSPLREVFTFIEANYQQPITLTEVAQAVGYAPAYLTDLIRRLSGKTVHQWIVERRMTAACSLLLETERSVEEIAAAVGYSYTGCFFRQFRLSFGTTPKTWRKAQLECCGRGANGN